MANTRVTTPVTDFDKTNTTQGLKLPSGTNSNQPSGVQGMIRNDTGETTGGSISALEHHNGTNWQYFAAKKSENLVGSPILFVLTTDTIESYDITDTSNIVQLDSLTTQSLTRGVCYDSENSIIYVTNRGNIISVDVSDTSNMSILQTFSPTDYYTFLSPKLDSNTNTLYVLDYSNRKIVSINVSTPSNMSIRYDLYDPSAFNGPQELQLDTTNKIAYIAALGSNTFAAVDISDPDNLTTLDFVQDTTAVNGVNDVAVDLENEIAYTVGKTTGSLASYDISDPSNLTLLDSISNTNLQGAYNVQLDLSNQVAFVSGFTNDCVVSIDISDPNNLSQLSVLTDVTNLDECEYLQYDEGSRVLYASNGAGIVDTKLIISIDASDPNNLSILDVVAGTQYRSATYFSI